MESRLARLCLLSLVFSTALILVAAVDRPKYARNNYKYLPAMDDYRTVIVHLDNWTYDDIASECKKDLGEDGYAAVQISPVTPHGQATHNDKYRDNGRMSVASYEIKNESGDEEQLKNMIAECRNKNVRVLVDVVLNNMMRKNDKGPYATQTEGNKNKNFGPEKEPSMYFEKHFHDDLVLTKQMYETEPTKVREGQLDGHFDLKQIVDNAPNVHMIHFLYKLIGLGVVGFRIINADHMDPEELERLFDTLPDLPFEKEPTRPFIYNDVYDPLHEPNSYAIHDRDYVKYTRVTDYKVAAELSRSIKHFDNDLSHFERFHFPKPIKANEVSSTEWNLRASEDAVVFVSTAMTSLYKIKTMTPYPELGKLQRDAKIQHTFIDPVYDDKAGKVALGFLLALGHGVPLITSKYINVKTFDISKEGKPCHRRDTTKNTMRWRNFIMRANGGKFPEITNWKKNNKNQVAFCVGKHGFVVLNNEEQEKEFNGNFQTCFEKPGFYCDIFGGGVRDSKATDIKSICAGSYIEVKSDKTVQIHAQSTQGVQLFSSDYVISSNGRTYSVWEHPLAIPAACIFGSVVVVPVVINAALNAVVNAAYLAAAVYVFHKVTTAFGFNLF